MLYNIITLEFFIFFYITYNYMTVIVMYDIILYPNTKSKKENKIKWK